MSVLVMPLMLLAGAASADTGCDECTVCVPYLSFVNEASLSSEVGAIGAAALHREGKAFSTDADIKNSLSMRVENDCARRTMPDTHSGVMADSVPESWRTLIPDPCRTVTGPIMARCA